ncbi:hypothetical protein E2C01_095171 [Portunus trituberculatus]|uniref:Uncharacterized protein n=1 Tax=Portunus trituberculatus TaxID=210409 RepID=A0A5B7JY35_PORTR|nr:hypothetical protein [Portunus trituberculatus]
MSDLDPGHPLGDPWAVYHSSKLEHLDVTSSANAFYSVRTSSKHLLAGVGDIEETVVIPALSVHLRQGAGEGHERAVVHQEVEAHGGLKLHSVSV